MPSTAVSSCRAPTARPSVSESRSRKSIGAVLWDTPRARSSLIWRRFLCSVRSKRVRYGLLLASPSGGGLVAVGPTLGESRQLAQLALNPLQFGRHDRHVDDDQGEEDDVGAGDVLACLVERQSGGCGEQQGEH